MQTEPPVAESEGSAHHGGALLIRHARRTSRSSWLT